MITASRTVHAKLWFTTGLILVTVFGCLLSNLPIRLSKKKKKGKKRKKKDLSCTIQTIDIWQTGPAECYGGWARAGMILRK